MLIGTGVCLRVCGKFTSNLLGPESMRQRSRKEEGKPSNGAVATMDFRLNKEGGGIKIPNSLLRDVILSKAFDFHRL